MLTQRMNKIQNQVITIRLMNNIHDLSNDDWTCHEQQERHDGVNENSQEHFKTRDGEHVTGAISEGVNLAQCEQVLPDLDHCQYYSSNLRQQIDFLSTRREHIFIISQFVIELLSIRTMIVLFKVLSTTNIFVMIIQHFFRFLLMFSLLQMLDQIWLNFESFSSSVALTKRWRYVDAL